MDARGPRLWPHFVARCTVSGTRDSVGRVRNPIHFSNTQSRSRGAFLRPGFATLLRSPRIEGWAERRETFGCSAEHPRGAPISALARVFDGHARRLRGALRPMTRDARLSALHRGGFSPGPALPSPAAPAVLQRRGVAFGSVQRAPRTPGVVPGRGGARAPRGNRFKPRAPRPPPPPPP